MRPWLPTTLLCLSTALALGACDDESDDNSDPTTTAADGGDAPADGGDGAPASGVCAADQAAMMSGTVECVFEPADVDCAAACANIAAVCADNACDENCTGLESDMTLCSAACEGTKGLACSNLTFGCYASNSACNDVGACVDANL